VFCHFKSVMKNCDCNCSKGLRGEARETSTSGGVLSKYVVARRLSATKHMRLFQEPAKKSFPLHPYPRPFPASPEFPF
jgi:hypothetical protein